jgi:hypothetical protein
VDFIAATARSFNLSDGNGTSSDPFTQTTHQSWFSRLGGAMSGLVFGLILLPVAAYLLFWNEGRAVQTARSLTEGAGQVRSVPAERPDAANDGRLIHLSGPVRVGQPPVDTDLTVAPPNGTLRLLRRVEMYQWKEEQRSETRTALGGGQETVTTTSYQRVWQEGRVDSSRFRQQDGHQNPEPRFVTRGFNAQGAMLGGFRITDAQLNGLSADTAFAPPGTQSDGTLFIGRDPTSPSIGDLRVSWRVAAPEAISVVGAQINGGVGPYATRAGDRIFLLSPGSLPAEAMFQEAQDANSGMTWLLRLAGLVVMFIGWTLLFNPLKVLSDVIPPLGAVVGFGTKFLAGILTVLVATPVIALAWLFYRPLTAAIVIAVGVALAFGIAKLRGRKAPVTQPA